MTHFYRKLRNWRKLGSIKPSDLNNMTPKRFLRVYKTKTGSTSQFLPCLKYWIEVFFFAPPPPYSIVLWTLTCNFFYWTSSYWISKNGCFCTNKEGKYFKNDISYIKWPGFLFLQHSRYLLWWSKLLLKFKRHVIKNTCI